MAPSRHLLTVVVALGLAAGMVAGQFELSGSCKPFDNGSCCFTSLTSGWVVDSTAGASQDASDVCAAHSLLAVGNFFVDCKPQDYCTGGTDNFWKVYCGAALAPCNDEGGPVRPCKSLCTAATAECDVEGIAQCLDAVGLGNSGPAATRLRTIFSCDGDADTGFDAYPDEDCTLVDHDDPKTPSDVPAAPQTPSDVPAAPQTPSDVPAAPQTPSDDPPAPQTPSPVPSSEESSSEGSAECELTQFCNMAPAVPGVCTTPREQGGVGLFAELDDCVVLEFEDQYALSALIVRMKELADVGLPVCTPTGWSALLEHLCLVNTAPLTRAPAFPGLPGGLEAPLTACRSDCSNLATECDLAALVGAVSQINPEAAARLAELTSDEFCGCLQPSPPLCRPNTAFIPDPAVVPTPVPGVEKCFLDCQPNALATRLDAVCADYFLALPGEVPTFATVVGPDVIQQEAFVQSAGNVNFFLDAFDMCQPGGTKEENEIARRNFMALSCSMTFVPCIQGDEFTTGYPPCREVCEAAVATCGGVEVDLAYSLGPAFDGAFDFLTLLQVCELFPPADGDVPCNAQVYVNPPTAPPQPTVLRVTDMEGSLTWLNWWIFFGFRTSFTLHAGPSGGGVFGAGQADVTVSYQRLDGSEKVFVAGQTTGSDDTAREFESEFDAGLAQLTIPVRFCVESITYPGNFVDTASPQCIVVPGLGGWFGPSAPRPNIVIILADDLGHGDLEVFDGSPAAQPIINTPRLNEMAAAGMVHRQMLMADSTCTPSRAALLAGRYPIRMDMAADIRRVILEVSTPGGIPTDEYLIGNFLSEHGYTSAFFGKWHLGANNAYANDYAHLPYNFGYDAFWGIPGFNSEVCHPDFADKDFQAQQCQLIHGTAESGTAEVVEQPVDISTMARRVGDRTVDFIADRAASGQPFHAFASFLTPHTTLLVTPEFEGTGGDRGLYGDVVTEIDYNVGRILDALVDAGVAENTYVLFSSDNGPALEERERGGSRGMLSGGKGQIFEGGIRVPGISWWPSVIAAGSQTYEAFSALDILPTIAGLLGEDIADYLPADRVIDGRDYSSVLYDASTALPDRMLYHYCGKSLHAVRNGNLKVHLASPVWTDPVMQACPAPEDGFRLVVCPCNLVTQHDLPSPDNPTACPPIYNVVADPSESTPLSCADPAIRGWLLATLAATEIHYADALNPPRLASAFVGSGRPDLQPFCDTFTPETPCVEGAESSLLHPSFLARSATATEADGASSSQNTYAAAAAVAAAVAAVAAVTYYRRRSTLASGYEEITQ